MTLTLDKCHGVEVDESITPLHDVLVECKFQTVGYGEELKVVIVVGAGSRDRGCGKEDKVDGKYGRARGLVLKVVRDEK